MKTVLQSMICAICETKMRPPFKMCKDMHLVCSNCYMHIAIESGVSKSKTDCVGTEVELKMFDTMFKNTYDHCQYNCGYFGELLELDEHERECEFVGKSSRCLIGSCQWVGQSTLLVQHVKTHHPQQLVHLSPEKSFTMDVANLTKLVLQFDANYFINYLYWSLTRQINEQIYIMIYYLDRYGPTVYPDVKLDEYKIYTPQDGNTLSKIKMIPTEKISEEEISRTDFILRQGTNVTFLKDKTLNFNVKMSNSEEVILPEKVLSDLECTICIEIMYGQIKMCNRGHSFCENCVKKLRRCPDCNGAISKSRNYTLEALTMKLFQQCKYSDSGCLISCCSEKMERHAKLCVYKPAICDLCNWTGTFLQLKQHYKNIHQRLQELLMPYSYEIYERDFDGVLFNVGTDIFTLSSVLYDDFYFAVDHITDDDSTEYNFDLKFFNPVSEYSVEFSLLCRVSTMDQVKDFKYTVNEENVCRIPRKLFANFILEQNVYCYVLNIYKD